MQTQVYGYRGILVLTQKKISLISSLMEMCELPIFPKSQRNIIQIMALGYLGIILSKAEEC